MEKFTGGTSGMHSDHLQRERERETANCMRLKRPIRDFVKHAAGQLFLKTGEGSNVIDIQ